MFRPPSRQIGSLPKRPRWPVPSPAMIRTPLIQSCLFTTTPPSQAAVLADHSSSWGEPDLPPSYTDLFSYLIKSKLQTYEEKMDQERQKLKRRQYFAMLMAGLHLASLGINELSRRVIRKREERPNEREELVARRAGMYNLSLDVGAQVRSGGKDSIGNVVSGEITTALAASGLVAVMMNWFWW